MTNTETRTDLPIAPGTPCAPAGRTRRSSHPAASRPADLCAAPPTLLQLLSLRIEELRRGKHYGTARNYARSAASFARFLNGEELPLAALTEETVADYNAHLVSRGVSRNTVSFYMRNLRAAYNRAVALRLVEQTHPFHHVYTGVDRTRKRAVGSDLMARLGKLDLPPGSPLPAQNRPPGRQHPLPPPQNRAADHDPHRTLHPVDSRPLPFVGRRHTLCLPDPDRHRRPGGLCGVPRGPRQPQPAAPTPLRPAAHGLAPHLLHSAPQLGHRGAQPRHPAFGHQRGPGPHLRTDHADLPRHAEPLGHRRRQPPDSGGAGTLTATAVRPTRRTEYVTEEKDRGAEIRRPSDRIGARCRVLCKKPASRSTNTPYGRVAPSLSTPSRNRRHTTHTADMPRSGSMAPGNLATERRTPRNRTSERPARKSERTAADRHASPSAHTPTRPCGASGLRKPQVRAQHPANRRPKHVTARKPSARPAGKTPPLLISRKPLSRRRQKRSDEVSGSRKHRL